MNILSYLKSTLEEYNHCSRFHLAMILPKFTPCTVKLGHNNPEQRVDPSTLFSNLTKVLLHFQYFLIYFSRFSEF